MTVPVMLPRPVCRALVARVLVPLLLVAGGRTATASAAVSAVAVFPVENVSGGAVPAEKVRAFLIDRLASAGIRVLRNEVLDDFMTRHRIRYAAGVDAETAERLKQETGVDAVVIASVDLSSETAAPKFALMARLVSLTGMPTVVWADDTGMAGDDAPGLFDLGVVDDYQKLQAAALKRVGDSLLTFVKTGQPGRGVKSASKFRPKSFYRTVTVEPGRTYSVAVVPFFNLSDRRNAGNVLALLFMRHLAAFPQFRVIDVGTTRRQLLDARIIMDGGLSITDAETVASLIDADFVLAGRVVRYDDNEGPGARPRVEFSTVLIEKKSRRVVWSSNSDNDGGDGVRLFERGWTRTAHAMATQMVALTAQMIVSGK